MAYSLPGRAAWRHAMLTAHQAARMTYSTWLAYAGAWRVLA